MPRATRITLTFHCTADPDLDRFGNGRLYSGDTHSFLGTVWVCSDPEMIEKRNLRPTIQEVVSKPCSKCGGQLRYQRPSQRRGVAITPVLVGYNPRLPNPLDRYQFPARASEAALMPGMKPIWLTDGASIDRFTNEFNSVTGKSRWHEALNLTAPNLEAAIDPPPSKREDDSQDLDPGVEIGVTG